MIDQFHDGIKFGTFLDGHSISGVGADAIMPTRSLKRYRQRGPLLLRIGIGNGDAHEKQPVHVTESLHSILGFLASDHVVIPGHLLVEPFHDGRLESGALRAEIFQQSGPGEVQTSGFSTDGFFQIFHRKVLEDERGFAHGTLARGRQFAQEPVLVLLMMLDEFDGARKRFATWHAHGPVAAPFDDVVMDAADVDYGECKVSLMIRLFA